jgi:hypothetical protein
MFLPIQLVLNPMTDFYKMFSVTRTCAEVHTNFSCLKSVVVLTAEGSNGLKGQALVMKLCFLQVMGNQIPYKVTGHKETNFVTFTMKVFF